MLIVLIMLKTVEYTKIDEADTFISNSLVDDTEMVDMFDLNYRFAVNQIDERVGRIVAE